MAVKSAKIIAGFKTGLNEIQVKHRRSFASLLISEIIIVIK